MTVELERCCANCTFYEKGEGECRRFPPQNDQYRNNAFFPKVAMWNAKVYWCGEFESVEDEVQEILDKYQ